MFILKILTSLHIIPDNYSKTIASEKNMNIKHLIILLTGLMVISFAGTCLIFDTEFALASIDWFSFFAGGFLGSEALYKILKYKKSSSGIQASRIIRIVIGFCIFIIHIIQFFWGTDAEVFRTTLTRTLIDWFAFLFGIFLMAEGFFRIVTNRRARIIDQFLRAFRAIIGTCVFAIHYMQFIRDY